MASAEIRVVVVYSPQPRVVDQVELVLPNGATLLQALKASGVIDRHPEIDPARAKLGVWGKLRQPDDVLRDADRVEVYRSLKVDPKEARRQRYQSHRETVKAREAQKKARESH